MTPKRVDLNQVSLVQYARRMGANVEHLHTIGRGCPDLLVAYRGRWLVVEVKADNGRLTPDEARWHAAFSAPVQVWRTVADVVRTLEGVGKELDGSHD
jgi:hypothetical protein